MSDKDYYVQKMKNLYLQKTGVLLTDEEALAYLESLVVLVGSVYLPVPKILCERKVSRDDKKVPMHEIIKSDIINKHSNRNI